MATAPRTLKKRYCVQPDWQPPQRSNAHQRGYDRTWRRLSRAYLQRIIHETGELNCGICGKSMLGLNDRDITVDHIVPPSSAGPERSPAYMELHRDESNWRPACRSCNSRKQDR